MLRGPAFSANSGLRTEQNVDHVLKKNASGYPLDFPLRLKEGGAASRLARRLRVPGTGTTHRQHPQILLRGENRQRLRPIGRRNYRCDEQLGQFDSSFAVNRSVEGK